MLKIYHTSDIHIGTKNKYLEDSLMNIQIVFLNRLYSNAKENDVKYVVIAGDLFDSNFIPSKIAAKILEVFVSYKEINTIILPGGGAKTPEGISGHDSYTNRSIYKRPDIVGFFKESNIHLLTPKDPCLIIDGVAFYGGFFEVPKIDRLNANYHIGVVHGCFSQNPRQDEIPITHLEESFFDYICLGHYHSFRKFSKSTYSGALIQFEFLKPKEASSGYVEVALGDGVNVKYISFEDAPRFLKMDVLNKEDIEFIKNISNNTYVQIKGYAEEYSKEIEKLLSKNVVLADYPIVYERDSIYEIVENSLDEILDTLKDEFKCETGEIKEFILNNIKGNLTKPAIEEYLLKRFDLKND